MSEKRARLTGAICLLCLTLALLTGIIWVFAGSGPLFEAEMTRFAPSASTGWPPQEYPAMAAHIGDYLAGRADDFQFYLTNPSGESSPCFHDYELIHMADCRRLIQLDGWVGAICLALALLLFLRLSRHRKEPQTMLAAIHGAGQALWGMSIIAVALALWAIINFDGLFITFHHLAFRNDYWLLNPRTDLLIRLMPESMFIDLGLKGLTVFLLGLALLVAGLLALRRHYKKGTKP